MKKAAKCVSCGKDFECERSELHEMGFPHPPSDASSVTIAIQNSSESFLPGRPGYRSFSFWHTICPSCGERFAEAARDQVVLGALCDLLGWYVRQGIDLKACVDEVRIRKKVLGDQP